MSNDHDTTTQPTAPGPVELPIACTLEAGEGGVRVGRWRALYAQAAPTSVREPDRLLIRYAADPDVLEELQDLVAAERDCCGFADWQLVTGERFVELQIRADPGGLDALAAVIQAS